MSVTYYKLIHVLTGYGIGKYNSYEQAECVRGKMDDWQMWLIEPFTEQL